MVPRPRNLLNRYLPIFPVRLLPSKPSFSQFFSLEFQVKPLILELYQKYYYPLKKQLIPCIPGLVVSILPGLDEQNEELQKKVFASLDQACESAGKRHFIGALWMVWFIHLEIRVFIRT